MPKTLYKANCRLCIPLLLKMSVYGRLAANYYLSKSVQKFLTNGYIEHHLMHIVIHLRKQKRQKFVRARSKMKSYHELIANQKLM